MFAIIASLFLSGAAHTNAADPLSLRSYTGEECGVSYASTERAECGVREWNSCPSAACPDSKPEEDFTVYTPTPLCRNPRNCNGEYKNAAANACSRSNFLRRSGRLITWGLEGPDGINATCKASAVIASCPAQACGAKAFNPCPDLNLATNNTCSLLMTRIEVSDYIESARSQIDLNAQLYATQKAIFLVQAKTKQESACLIRDWTGKDQFEDLVNELKSRFLMTYGEAFDAQPYDCQNEALAPEEYNYRDLRCTVVSQAEVLKKLDNPALETDLRTFYGTCLTQKAYQAQERWFKHNIGETSRLINDVVAARDGQKAEALNRLKNDMEAKKVVVP